jgi:hypothetical protein
MAAGEAEKKEEGITHHGCGAAGAPSGLRSLSLLPAHQKPHPLLSHYAQHESVPCSLQSLGE